jgi:DMSO/TMAO reductase YedYZ molybdopterin-dependent catalytic subunit
MLGKVKEKLIRSKKKWAEEGRLLTGEVADPAVDRLPPGQRKVDQWPVLDLGIQPELTQDEMRLEIDGLVENPVTLDWQGLHALPKFSQTTDIHCVTAWSRYDNRFDGVSVASLIDLVKPTQAAQFVLFEAHDGYTTNLSRAVFEDETAMLATHWEGAPLTPDHGGPLRVVVPKKYFWKSAKWVKRITFSADVKPGFWEVRGYHYDGDPWQEERYAP